MDFTREPIIETIITPREGCKLVIRSSKSNGQEEFVVDAVEIVSFGKAQFFRSLEKPKPFLAPVSDYEVLEVKEARMVLKHAGPDKAIKIGGGREVQKQTKEQDKTEERASEAETSEVGEKAESDAEGLERKRGRRRPQRRRRDREGSSVEGDDTQDNAQTVEGQEGESAPAERTRPSEPTIPSPNLSALLAPPPMLISETIGRYRDNQNFKGAFFLTEEEEYKPHGKAEELLKEDEEIAIPHIDAQPSDNEVEYSPFEQGTPFDESSPFENAIPTEEAPQVSQDDESNKP